MTAQIVVHNIQTATHKYPDVDALVLSICEWYDEIDGHGHIDVSQSEKLITLEYIHYDSNDSNTNAVIIKADLPHVVDAEDLYQQLKSCG